MHILTGFDEIWREFNVVLFLFFFFVRFDGLLVSENGGLPGFPNDMGIIILLGTSSLYHPYIHDRVSENVVFVKLPSGKRLHNELERSTMLLMGKPTISTGPFSIAMFVYQRVTFNTIMVSYDTNWPPGNIWENLHWNGETTESHPLNCTTLW